MIHVEGAVYSPIRIVRNHSGKVRLHTSTSTMNIVFASQSRLATDTYTAVYKVLHASICAAVFAPIRRAREYTLLLLLLFAVHTVQCEYL